MFSAIVIILSLPFTDLSRFRGMQFNYYSIATFYFFLANFLILMVLGAKHVESPFIQLGQLSAIIYFLYFSAIPFLCLIENTLVYLKDFTAINSKNSCITSNMISSRSCFSLNRSFSSTAILNDSSDDNGGDDSDHNDNDNDNPSDDDNKSKSSSAESTYPDWSEDDAWPRTYVKISENSNASVPLNELSGVKILERVKEIDTDFKKMEDRQKEVRAGIEEMENAESVSEHDIINRYRALTREDASYNSKEEELADERKDLQEELTVRIDNGTVSIKIENNQIIIQEHNNNNNNNNNNNKDNVNNNENNDNNDNKDNN